MRAALALATSIQHSALRVAGFENEDDDDDSLPDEACGPIITPSKSRPRKRGALPKIGERSRENEAPGERLQPRGGEVQFGQGAILRYSSTPTLRSQGIEDDGEDENEAPGEIARGGVFRKADSRANAFILGLPLGRPIR